MAFLIADGSPDPSFLGKFVEGFALLASILFGAISLLIAAIALWRKRPSPDMTYITRGELTQEAARLEMKLVSEVNRLESDIKELRTYIRDSIHDVRGKLHIVDLRIVRLDGMMCTFVEKNGGTVPPPLTVNEKDLT